MVAERIRDVRRVRPVRVCRVSVWRRVSTIPMQLLAQQFRFVSIQTRWRNHSSLRPHRRAALLRVHGLRGLRRFDDAHRGIRTNEPRDCVFAQSTDCRVIIDFDHRDSPATIAEEGGCASPFPPICPTQPHRATTAVGRGASGQTPATTPAESEWPIASGPAATVCAIRHGDRRADRAVETQNRRARSEPETREGR